MSGTVTTSELFERLADCTTPSQLDEDRFVEDINCQSVKLLGQENRTDAGGTSFIESVGDTAAAVQIIANTHPEM